MASPRSCGKYDYEWLVALLCHMVGNGIAKSFSAMARAQSSLII